MARGDEHSASGSAQRELESGLELVRSLLERPVMHTEHVEFPGGAYVRIDVVDESAIPGGR